VLFAALGIDAPVFWGVVMMFFCLLPFGAWVVWLPAALVFFAAGDWLRGVILAGFGLGVVSAADNVLRPVAPERHRAHERVARADQPAGRDECLRCARPCAGADAHGDGGRCPADLHEGQHHEPRDRGQWISAGGRDRSFARLTLHATEGCSRCVTIDDFY
jgi:hypothetical protein